MESRDLEYCGGIRPVTEACTTNTTNIDVSNNTVQRRHNHGSQSRPRTHQQQKLDQKNHVQYKANDDDHAIISNKKISSLSSHLLCLYQRLSSTSYGCYYRLTQCYINRIRSRPYGICIGMALILSSLVGLAVVAKFVRYSRIRSFDPSVITWSYPVVSNAIVFHGRLDTQVVTQKEEVVDNTRAIFLLSMGQDALKSTIVERCLISIRRNGNYLGYVVLLTDAPVTRYSKLESYDPNFIVFRPFSEKDWNWGLRNDMPYKRFKTYILDYIDKDPRLDTVQLVYYLDIDIVIGKNLQLMFNDLETTYGIRTTMKSIGLLPRRNVKSYNVSSLSFSRSHVSATSHVYFFKGNYPWRPLQGGQFILIRYNSDLCLSKWRSYIDEHPEDDKDQSALTLLLNESLKIEASSTSLIKAQRKNITTSVNIDYVRQNSQLEKQHCRFTIMKQYPHLQFVNETSMIELTYNTHRNDYPTMIHIKNTEHGHWISDEIQTKFFQTILNITSKKELYHIGGKTRIQPDQRKSKL